MSTEHSALLEEYFFSIEQAAGLGPVLDLACGSGRNGRYLTKRGISTVFADLSATALDAVSAQLTDTDRSLATLWQIDLEQPQPEPLELRQFGGIMVFRYLHRALMSNIKNSVIPGGIVIYETFTTEQALLGRPKNPHYLLNPDELLETFSDWNILYSFEGIVSGAGNESPTAIAQLVALKPDRA
ncbi:MAG: methyltransferase domain-containing protein [Halioglobus sp.]